MKRVILCLLAVATLASCQKDQTLKSSVGPAIAFENASVDYATRAAVDPSTTTANISEFSVWGFMDEPSGSVFVEEKVSKSGSAWSYANTQYWLAGHQYYFAAVSPVANADVVVDTENANSYGLGSIAFTNTDGSVDLLYAAESVATANADLSAMAPVGFSFSHLLSKVKFTFTNGFDNANTTIKVKNVTMSAPKSGSIDLNVANWWDNDDWKLGNEFVTLQFGDVDNAVAFGIGVSSEADAERLTIPAGVRQSYEVKFTVELYNGDVLADTQYFTSVVSGVALEMGKAYNFKATINAVNSSLYPIEFNVVEVKEWVNADPSEFDVPAQELKDLDIAEAQTFTLTNNAVALNTIEVAGTFDGAGNTVAVKAGKEADFLEGNVFPFIKLVGGNAIVKNLTIDGKYSLANDKGVRNIIIAEAGTYVLDNIVSINATYPFWASTGTLVVDLTVNNSVLAGWSSFGSGLTFTGNNVEFKVGKYAQFRPYGTTVLTNCSFEEGFNVDLSRLDAGKTVTFNNCTYGGAPLTAENIITFDEEDNITMAGTYSIN